MHIQNRVISKNLQLDFIAESRLKASCDCENFAHSFIDIRCEITSCRPVDIPWFWLFEYARCGFCFVLLLFFFFFFFFRRHYSKTCLLRSLHSATTWTIWPVFHAQTVLYRNSPVLSDHLVNATSNREIFDAPSQSPAFYDRSFDFYPSKPQYSTLSLSLFVKMNAEKSMPQKLDFFFKNRPDSGLFIEENFRCHVETCGDMYGFH